MVGANEKIFLTAGTIFLVNQKMVLGFATMVFVAPTRVWMALTTVRADN